MPPALVVLGFSQPVEAAAISNPSESEAWYEHQAPTRDNSTRRDKGSRRFYGAEKMVRCADPAQNTRFAPDGPL